MAAEKNPALIKFRDDLVEALDGLGVNICHIEKAPEYDAPVVCWQEINSSHYAGDDRTVATVLQVQIDLFTADEYDTREQYITEALDDIALFHTYEGTDYDQDREEWRYIWTASIWGG